MAAGLVAGPVSAGPVDFGPWFILGPILAGLIYLLYVAVATVAVQLWRRGRRNWAAGLAVVWVVCAVLLPFLDWQRARLQADAHWALRIMPETLPIDGRTFLSDDTVLTPHTAVHRFNAPEAVYGLYDLANARAALTAGPVNLADFSYFQHVPEPGAYKDRRTFEVPAGTRITPDYLMLSRFHGEGRAVLSALRHPDDRALPRGFGVDFAIVAVDDPTAFDLRAARIVMLVPFSSQSYYPAPFNPLVRRIYNAASYRDRMALLIPYFCADLDPEARDKCRRDI